MKNMETVTGVYYDKETGTFRCFQNSRQIANCKEVGVTFDPISGDIIQWGNYDFLNEKYEVNGEATHGIVTINLSKLNMPMMNRLLIDTGYLLIYYASLQ
jgi:hypothetical protein